MKRTSKITVMVAALAALNGFAFADAKGNEIMNTVSDFKKPSYSRSQVIMTLEDKSGAKEARQIVEYGKEADGKTYVVMDFKGPTSIKDTRFLCSTAISYFPPQIYIFDRQLPGIDIVVQASK